MDCFTIDLDFNITTIEVIMELVKLLIISLQWVVEPICYKQ